MKKADLVVGQEYACYAPSKQPGDYMTVKRVILLGTEKMSLPSSTGWRLPKGQYHRGLTEFRNFAQQSGLPVAIRGVYGDSTEWRPSVVAINQFRMPYDEYVVKEAEGREAKRTKDEQRIAEEKRKSAVAKEAEAVLEDALGRGVYVHQSGSRNLGEFTISLREDKLALLVEAMNAWPGVENYIHLDNITQEKVESPT